MSADRPTPHSSLGGFAARVAVVIGLLAALALLWRLADIVLLGFFAVLLAMLLRLLARPIERLTPLPHGVCLALSGILVLSVLAWTLFLLGSHVSGEFDTLLDRARQGGAAIQAEVGGSEIGRVALAQLHQVAGMLAGFAKLALSDSLSTLEGAFVVVFSAAYLAAQPSLYVDGCLRLVPPRHQARAAATIGAIGRAVRLWLAGQLVEMALIGALTALAAWLVGLPTPLALGLIAGIAEFVPYLGPVVAAVPALLVAVTQGSHTVMWTLGAYAAIHLFEGNILMPLLQRWLVHVPPALMLLGIAGMAQLFGMLGLILAAPTVVAVFVAVRELYLRDGRLQATPPPGGHDSGHMDLGTGRELGPAIEKARPMRRLDRLLLLAHAIIALLALDIVVDIIAGGSGRLLPWPRGGEVAVAFAILEATCPLVSLPWQRRRRSTDHARERDAEHGTTAREMRGSPCHLRRRFGTAS